MKILILTWKDIKNPLAGGAEIVTDELLKRLVAKNHNVTLLTSSFKEALSREIINGYQVIRLGDIKTVYVKAFNYYRKFLNGKFDLVIDQINTIPFFAKFYVKEKNIILIHQLAREVWFYEIFFPLNLIGYVLEPFYLRLLKDREVITFSESTKKDLLRCGFEDKKIHIIKEGIKIKSLQELPKEEQIKEASPTILFLGNIRPMKRPCHVIRAFEIAKKEIEDLKLWIVGMGKGRYFKRILELIKKSDYRKDIIYFGKVNDEEKIKILQKVHLLCVTSVKEGWGLVVTEANSQGTPAIVYNVDGLKDSVINNQTGIICQKNNPQNLAENIKILLKDKETYNFLRRNCWEWSKKINFDKSFDDFERIIYQVIKN